MDGTASMAAARSRRRPDPALVWIVGSLAFPVAGLVATAAAGPITGAPSAALGGAVAGLVIGAAQAGASRRLLPPVAWTGATALGSAIGLLAGAVAVGFRTGLADLALQGALTGLAIGLAQAAVLPASPARRAAWAAASPALWAAGWTVTTLAGVQVSQHFAVFGLTGALTLTALSGVLLRVLLGPSMPRRA